MTPEFVIQSFHQHGDDCRFLTNPKAGERWTASALINQLFRSQAEHIYAKLNNLRIYDERHLSCAGEDRIEITTPRRTLIITRVA